MSITHINIEGRTWFDRLNGNSYCSSQISVVNDDGYVDEYRAMFELGYGDAYIRHAFELLDDLGVFRTAGSIPSSRHDCRERGITVRTSICSTTKKECVAWGETVKEEG